MRILGISAYYHDAAAVLLVDVRIVCAVQEERLSRKKGDARFPHQAIGVCLAEGACNVDDLDYVVFYEHPLLKFERLLLSYHWTAPHSLSSFVAAIPSWITHKLWIQYEIPKELGLTKDIPIKVCDHHLAHAASAFFPSPFEQAAILTVDGVGEWSTTTYGTGIGNTLSLTHQLKYPHSLGLLYSAFTYYTGFKINSGEYKLMGLAPYGTPIYADRIKEQLVQLNSDGSLILNQKYFNFIQGLTMTNAAFHALFGGEPRQPESPITQREKDLAACIQAVTEECFLNMARQVKAQTNQQNLVLAGGVAHNSVAIGKLYQANLFERIWIQPAAGDAGGALGAALWAWHMYNNQPRVVDTADSMQGAFLGPTPDIERHTTAVETHSSASLQPLSDQELAKKIAEKLVQGKVIGVARGRMEFGARALGHRSILADARQANMRDPLNQKIKYREIFRPFAPMVLLEDAAEYFENCPEDPYMLMVVPVKEKYRTLLPSITHVDHSARVQTIDQQRHPFMYQVLREFKKLTGCSVIINTSFNVRGEPIVATAEDAYRCFLATDIDGVVIENRYIEKESATALSETERQDWLRRFERD